MDLPRPPTVVAAPRSAPCRPPPCPAPTHQPSTAAHRLCLAAVKVWPAAPEAQTQIPTGHAGPPSLRHPAAPLSPSLPATATRAAAATIADPRWKARRRLHPSPLVKEGAAAPGGMTRRPLAFCR
ncbi:hypothetical protein PVAP13_5KG649807 [Panicum virgatum]|uniref:Uncharacterized protein n=1 Tax=Panicum virgatum TaxID=38727 RepID=A0A8T0SIY9_PANVG|nr:hypothetical protein PVAP13_5KG649807 [Panicum virgatum]